MTASLRICVGAAIGATLQLGVFAMSGLGRALEENTITQKTQDVAKKNIQSQTCSRLSKLEEYIDVEIKAPF